jgi:hypothetical protein
MSTMVQWAAQVTDWLTPATAGISGALAVGMFVVRKTRAVVGEWDALTRKRTLDHYKELIEHSEPGSKYRDAFVKSKNSQMFRQAFGFSEALNVEDSALELYLKELCSRKELKAFFSFYRDWKAQSLTPEAKRWVRFDVWTSGLQALLLLPVILLTVMAIALSKDASAVAALGLMVLALGLLEARFLSDLGKALLAIRVVNRLSRYHEAEARKDSEPDVVVQAALPIFVSKPKAVRRERGPAGRVIGRADVTG